jgi:hypothetical protein
MLPSGGAGLDLATDIITVKESEGSGGFLGVGRDGMDRLQKSQKKNEYEKSFFLHNTHL